MPIYTDRWFEFVTTKHDPARERLETYRPETSEIITAIKDVYQQSMPTHDIKQNLQEIIEACISAK